MQLPTSPRYAYINGLREVPLVLLQRMHPCYTPSGQPASAQYHSHLCNCDDRVQICDLEASSRSTHRKRHSRRHGRSPLPHSHSRGCESSMSIDEMLLEATTGNNHERQNAVLGRPHSQSPTHHPLQQMSLPHIRHRSQLPSRYYLAVSHTRSRGQSAIRVHSQHCLDNSIAGPGSGSGSPRHA